MNLFAELLVSAPSTKPVPVGRQSQAVTSTHSDGASSERLCEGGTVAVMFGTAQGEHAGLHNLCCREAGVVDCEGPSVAHHIEGCLAAGHQPPTEGRQP